MSLIKFLSEFYRRRIKRILPALTFYIALISILLTLVAPNPGNFLQTGFYALFGVSNISLYYQSLDYFGNAASLNPFTNTWSLGVEEQFYLIFPAIVFWTGYANQNQRGKSRLITILSLIIAASLFGFYSLLKSDFPAGYYLLLPRAWELCAGSLAYLASQSAVCKEAIKSIQRIPSWTLLSLITCIFWFWPAAKGFSATILAVSLTIAILLNQDLTPFKPSPLLTNKVTQYIGKISYSLYLWHWGAIVLFNWVLGNSSLGTTLAIPTMLITSIFSYHYVEQPFRSSPLGFKKWNMLGISFITAAITNTNISQIDFIQIISLPRLINAASPTNWLTDLACTIDAKKDLFAQKGIRNCLARKTEPQIYLIGDSHALHLVPMVQTAITGSKYSLSYGRVINSSKPEFPAIYMNAAKHKTNLITKEVISNSKPGDIAIISFYSFGMLDPNAHKNSKGEERILNGLKELTIKLISKGVYVVLVSDVFALSRAEPGLLNRNQDISISTCDIQLKLANKSDCDILKTEAISQRLPQDRIFSELTNDGALVWDPRKFITSLRSDDYFTIRDKNGMQIFFDRHHITKEYSTYLGAHFRKFLQVEGLLGG